MTIKFEGYSLAGKGPGTIFVEDAGGRHILSPPCRHSPDGFQWGYGGSGPSDTALALLKYVTGLEPPPAMYHKFKFDVVANFGSNFTITGDEIQEWITKFEENK